jgi:hypothetical protein
MCVLLTTSPSTEVIIHDDPDTAILAPDFVPRAADLLPAEMIKKAVP